MGTLNPALRRLDYLPRLHLSEGDFHALYEYSHSLPTGVTPGKRWKALTQGQAWVIGEYGVSPDGKTIPINWYKPVIRVKVTRGF